MAETRKLAAILATDGTGYSRLAAADEERTLARLRALDAMADRDFPNWCSASVDISSPTLD